MGNVINMDKSGKTETNAPKEGIKEDLDGTEEKIKATIQNGSCTKISVSSMVNLSYELETYITYDLDLVDKDAFNDMMVAVFIYGPRMDYKELADDLGFSGSSVYRWVYKGTAPHPCLWDNIRSWILEHLEERRLLIKQLYGV